MSPDSTDGRERTTGADFQRDPKLTTTAELAQLEQEARKNYVTEYLKNLKFDPSVPSECRSATADDFDGVRDFKLLYSLMEKRFAGEPEDLRPFLDQIHTAHELCHRSLRTSLFRLIFHLIEGEARETLRAYPEIDTYEKLVTFLEERYGPRETFIQAYFRLANAKQEPDESVLQYGDRLSRLAYLAKIASEKEKEMSTESATQVIELMALERFKIGSKLAISLFIKDHPDVVTLSAAIRAAVEFETTKIRQHFSRGIKVGGEKWCHYHKSSFHDNSECKVQQKSAPSKH